MTPSLNFKISVLPKYAPLLQFDVSKHHVMIGCDGSFRSHTTGVSQFYTRRILGLNLTSLAYVDMASEHGDRKVEHESYSRYDQHERCSPLMTDPPHVMIGRGLVDVDHVALRQLEGC